MLIFYDINSVLNKYKVNNMDYKELEKVLEEDLNDKIEDKRWISLFSCRT